MYRRQIYPNSVNAQNLYILLQVKALFGLEFLVILTLFSNKVTLKIKAMNVKKKQNVENPAGK